MGSSSPFVRRQARAVPVRSERAEAGVGSLHSFVSSFERCEDHVARSHRVTAILHDRFWVHITCTLHCT